MRGLRLYTSRRATGPAAAWMAVVLAGVSAPIAVAEVAVLTATRDNSIFDNGNSNGAGDAIFSGRTGDFGGQVVQRGLMAFSVADGVPAGSRVVSVNLNLSLIATSPNGGPASYALHRLTSDWGEGTSFAVGGTGAPPTPGDATWTNTFFPDQFWTLPGGDFLETVSASQTAGPLLGRYTWGTTPTLVADVQAMLDDPANDFGWILIGDEITPFSAKKFGSKDGLNESLYPTLTIEFAPCPWDCGDGDGEVGINDFLALLAQWDSIGTSCDFDLGPPGVGIDEFLDLLAHWGPCP
ncbi:MAG: DNRLRE domain-containing protein [Phycisphaerales bacterium]